MARVSAGRETATDAHADNHAIVFHPQYDGASNQMMFVGGDGGPATSAEMNEPHAVAVDAAGNVYISDTNNHRIRKIHLAGIISTFAGTGEDGFGGDGGPAADALLDTPVGLAVDGANLYVADAGNNRVRRIGLTTGVITTVAGSGYGAGGRLAGLRRGCDA